MKLLVMVNNDYNDMELLGTVSTLQLSGNVEKITYYNPTLKSTIGQFNILKLNDIENEVNIEEYDAVFIPGGKGVQYLRKDKTSLDIISKFKEDPTKWVFAICDAPNALKEANIISDEDKFTSYPSEWSIDFRNKNYENKAYVVSKNLITGKAPYYTLEFALGIIENYFTKKLRNIVESGMKGE